ASTPNGMAKAERNLLPHRYEIARRYARRRQDRQIIASLPDYRFQLVGNIEMLHERRLAAAGHEDDFLDTGLTRLVDGILNQWPIDDRKQFLGDRFRRRKKASAQSRNREHGFADLHPLHHPAAI